MNSIGLAYTLLAAANSASALTVPPPALACLTRHYPVTAAQEGNVWYLVLPNGVRVPFDDQKRKSLEERLAFPDVNDVFEQRYTPGPIAPVTGEDQDPGRIRLTPLLDAIYGNAAANKDLVSIDFFGTTLRVHKATRSPFAKARSALRAAVTKEPALLRTLRRLSGAYNWRLIAGTNRVSAHAYGIAIDLDAKLGDYWRWRGAKGWRNRIPQPVVDAFESAGFIWGGRWSHYDTMHFEYRPELLDKSCWADAALQTTQ